MKTVYSRAAATLYNIKSIVNKKESHTRVCLTVRYPLHRDKFLRALKMFLKLLLWLLYRAHEDDDHNYE